MLSSRGIEICGSPAAAVRAGVEDSLRTILKRLSLGGMLVKCTTPRSSFIMKMSAMAGDATAASARAVIAYDNLHRAMATDPSSFSYRRIVFYATSAAFEHYNRN